MNKNDEIDYWKNRFNESASNFKTDAEIGLWSKHGFEQRFNIFFKILSNDYYLLEKNKRILDVGCGSGAYTREISNLSYSNIIGVDYSEKAIQLAKSKNDDIQYILSALPYLPFKKNSFDIVVCIGIFQYIVNEFDAITDINSVISEKKGVFIIETLNSLSMYALLKKIIEILKLYQFKGRITIKYERRYNYFKLKSILKDNGFNKFDYHGVYLFPKSLIFLEKLCKRYFVFDLLDKIPLISSLFAQSIIIKAGRVNENENFI